jgi:hypothetical protein
MIHNKKKLGDNRRLKLPGFLVKYDKFRKLFFYR